MNNLREIKSRLRSIRKNQQILGAMQMVSAVKLRRMQAVGAASRPYARRLEELVESLPDFAESGAAQHPLLAQRGARRAVWVVVSTDRGLCGSLNTNLFRFIKKAMQERAGDRSALALVLIGRKASDYFKRAEAKSGARIEQAYSLAEAQPEMIASWIWHACQSGQAGRVEVFYAQFKSVLRQAPVRMPLWPMAPDAGRTAARPKRPRLFEPDPGTIAGDLLPRYLASRIRQILLEEQVAEHSARMVMMDQAGRNAAEMINQIQMAYNALRQGMITRELADITTGVEAMA